MSGAQSTRKAVYLVALSCYVYKGCKACGASKEIKNPAHPLRFGFFLRQLQEPSLRE